MAEQGALYTLVVTDDVAAVLPAVKDSATLSVAAKEAARSPAQCMEVDKTLIEEPTCTSGAAAASGGATSVARAAADVADASSCDSIAREGDNVILDENEERQWSVRLRGKSSVKVGKFYVPLAPLVNAPWGAVFQVSANGQSLERLTSPPEVEGFRAPGASERDNSSLFDRNDQNQTLKEADIIKMRQEGRAGVEIIDALVTSSATFAAKTEFSQDKYKRKKAKKYCARLTLRRPTARVLCQMHFNRAPDRVWNLRSDSLGIMLSLANVSAGTKVLVVEACQGVVTAAVAERLGGLGTCVAAHVDPKSCPPLDAVKEMNLTARQHSTLHVATVGALLQAKEDADADYAEAEQRAAAAAAAARPASVAAPAAAAAAATLVAVVIDAAAAVAATKAGTAAAAVASTVRNPAGPQHAYATAALNAVEAAPSASVLATAAASTITSAVDAVDSTMDIDVATLLRAGTQTSADGALATAPDSLAVASAAGGSSQQQPQQAQQREGGFGVLADELNASILTGFGSALLAAPKIHPGALLSAVWPLLAPSASFVVFSCWPQPLAELTAALYQSRQAVMVQLHESWMRPHQVLPMRTHPEMSCSGTGGYILSGIKVIPESDGRPIWTASTSTAYTPAPAAALAGTDAGGAVPTVPAPPAAEWRMGVRAGRSDDRGNGRGRCGRGSGGWNKRGGGNNDQNVRSGRGQNALVAGGGGQEQGDSDGKRQGDTGLEAEGRKRARQDL